MATLNDALDIASVDPRDRFAFRGTPSRTLFVPGDRLFRFTSLPERAFTGNELFKSPWWQPQRTFNTIVRTAARLGVSIPDAARSGLAVATKWNPTMEWLAIIELKSAAYGWVGPASQQALTGIDRTVLLIGNLDQIYMPGLDAGGHGTSSPHAMLVHYGSVG